VRHYCQRRVASPNERSTRRRTAGPALYVLHYRTLAYALMERLQRLLARPESKVTQATTLISDDGSRGTMTSQFASSIIKLSSEGWADLACRKREPDECCIERDRLKARLGRHDDSRSGRIGKCG